MMTDPVHHIQNTLVDREALTFSESATYFRYWDEKRGTKSAPSRSDIDPIVEIPYLVKYLTLARVEPNDRFFYSVMGTGVRDRLGIEMTGRYLDEIDLHGFEAEISEFYRTVRDTLSPIFFVGHYGPGDTSEVAYEANIFPIAANEVCTHILIGMAYRSV